MPNVFEKQILQVIVQEGCECVGLLVYLSSSSQRTEFCALNCMANQYLFLIASKLEPLSYAQCFRIIFS